MKKALLGITLLLSGNAFASWRCEAEGETRRGRLESVIGTCERTERRAENAALDRCEDYGLDYCEITECWRDRRCDDHQPDPGPGPGPFPGPKRVVGYQHVKEQCFGNDYEKVQQQCGGRGMWHGIYCVVTFSDGTTKDYHGQVDFAIDGVQVCERSTRPANFNCVSSCDYTNGDYIRR